MRTIQTSNKQVDKFGAGEHGFAAGNPGMGVLATFLSPEWCDGVQQEIINVIKAGGLTPSSGNLAQMLAAMQAMFRSSAQVNAAIAAVVPPAALMAFMRSAAPAGWLECDGAAVSRTTYAALFAVVETTYGVGDGSTTFNLPDMRGEFLRGWDHGRGIDASRALGSAQGDLVKAHTHTLTTVNDTESTDLGSVSESGGSIDLATGRVNTGSTGGAENRPRNVAVMFCIKT